MSPVRPLLITADDDLADEALRHAAVADREIERYPDPVAAGEKWRTAPLILLDHHAAASAVASCSPGRAGIVLLSFAPEPDFWKTAFRIGAEHVVELSGEGARLVEILAEAREDAASRRGRVLAVLGGCGGAGASVLACATAVAAASRGDRGILVDCDPMAGGIDLTLGAETQDGLRWSGISFSGGRIASGALRDALPGRRIGPGSVSVLACDRDGPSTGLTADAVGAVIAAAQRAGDTVICDLPRNITEQARVALSLADLILLVVPAEVRAIAAATRLVGAEPDLLGEARIVVRGPALSGLTVADVGNAVGLDVLTSVRSRPTLPAEIDRTGLGSRLGGSLARAAGDVLAALDSGVGPALREAS